jgi:hypothetical protein
MMFVSVVAQVKAFEPEVLIDHVKKSIKKGFDCESQLPVGVLSIHGMSSARGRHLLNNICSLPGASYLEIGVWAGSTFVSALYGNTKTLYEAIAIDNWSQFGDQKDTFLKNTSFFLPKRSFRMWEGDSFKMNVDCVFGRPIDIYFYDGDHSVEAQRKAFTYFDSALADTFIAIIDDWEWPDVQCGTAQAFEELGYKILFEEKLLARYPNDPETWWNGMYIAVIQKSK